MHNIQDIGNKYERVSDKEDVISKRRFHCFIT
jgi:hypothetical protein